MPWRCGYTYSEQHGTVTMDGAEDTAFEVTDYKRMVEAYIDLSNMQAGDHIDVRQYMKIEPGGAYVQYAEIPYDDEQDYKMLWITPKPNSYGIKVTLQQTVGANRTLAYAVFKEKRK